MSIIRKMSSFMMIIFYLSNAGANNYQARPGEMLKIEISKTGLNRITNPPYKIAQVAGDDSAFKLKSDEDGTSIYLMPEIDIGQTIEISLKNNAGMVQDMELLVTNKKGQIIALENLHSPYLKNFRQQEIARMLRAMRDGITDKYYVQESIRDLGEVSEAIARQIRIYRYQDLIGGVFEVSNQTRKVLEIDTASFISRFDKVLASFTDSNRLGPREKLMILIIQKIADF